MPCRRSRAPADLSRQAVADELADDVADRRPGEAAEPGDVGAADRPEVVQGPQDQRRVVRARLLVGGLGRERHGGRVLRVGPLVCRLRGRGSAAVSWPPEPTLHDVWTKILLCQLLERTIVRVARTAGDSRDAPVAWRRSQRVHQPGGQLPPSPPTRIHAPVPHLPGNPPEDAVTRPIDPAKSASAGLAAAPASGSTVTAGSAARRRLGALYRRTRDIALKPVYAFYVTRLEAAVMAHPRPAHVAVIMDGNRRWATARGSTIRVRPPAGRREGARAHRLVRRPRASARSRSGRCRSRTSAGPRTRSARSPRSPPTRSRPWPRAGARRGCRSSSGSSAGATCCPRASPRSSSGRPRCRATTARCRSRSRSPTRGRDELLEAFRATVREAVEPARRPTDWPTHSPPRRWPRTSTPRARPTPT